MLTIDAQKLAEELIRQHIPHYSFCWTNSKQNFGVCNWVQREIKLSLDLTIRNDEAQVRDTILHEIAHALSPGHHHDRIWKGICVKIGAKPERCYTNNVKTGAEWTAKCRCGAAHRKFRAPRIKLICKWCKEPLQWQK